MRLLLALLSATAASAQYDYAEVIHKSLLFYEAERSGPLPINNRIDWRGDSAMGDAVTGGYYDAGDHVKFGFPMAAMTTQMAWGGVSFADGYNAAGEMDNLKDAIDWAVDYFVAASAIPGELVAQIGDGDADHGYWGRPEEMTMARPAFKIDAYNPGTEVACETAAALAAASLFYTAYGDSSRAETALEHARNLFALGDEHRGTYTNSIPAGSFYNSWSGYNDELVWSAAWLAKATGESSYLDKAEAMWDEFGFATVEVDTFDWDNKDNAANVILYELTGNARYQNEIDKLVSRWMSSAPRTPKGLIFLDQWGSLRHAANVAHLCLQISNLGLHTSECPEFARSQIHYMLGDAGHSYVVGYGNSPPEKPHHRAASCPDMPATCDWDAFNNPGPNYQVIEGALVGGPDANDNWSDDRSNAQTNEVATDYNAGFQSALAGLNSL